MGQIIEVQPTHFPYTRFPPFSKERRGSGRSGALFPVEPKQHETGEAGSGGSPCLLAFTGANHE